MACPQGSLLTCRLKLCPTAVHEAHRLIALSDLGRLPTTSRERSGRVAAATAIDDTDTTAALRSSRPAVNANRRSGLGDVERVLGHPDVRVRGVGECVYRGESKIVEVRCDISPVLLVSEYGTNLGQRAALANEPLQIGEDQHAKRNYEKC